MTIDELKKNNLILFECLSGSKAYGLDTPESDTDIKGVFYLPKEQFFGLHYLPQVSNETNDLNYYELGRFVELLLKNNPNALELLASPEECVLYRHPIMAQLNLPLFLSKLAKDTFAGYAVTQIKKARGLNKKIHNPLPKERKGILDFCYVLQDNASLALPQWLEHNQYQADQCGLVNIPHIKGVYALYYDEQNILQYKGLIKNDTVNSLHTSSIPKGQKAVAHLYFNLEGYSTYCKEYHAYWHWVENRNEARYQTNQAHGADYDSKNMMHTIRLLQTAEQIVCQQRLTIRVPNREELLAIKRGEYSYESLVKRSEDLIERIEHHFPQCPLPDHPDLDKVQNILVQMRNALYA